MALVGVVNAAPLEKRDNVGDATFFNAGLGACGITSSNSDFIVVVFMSFFDTFLGYAGGNPNNNPVCGRTLQANFVDVTVTDRCPAWAFGDIDLAPAMFLQLADLSVGRIHGVNWTLL
ncbi:hypothetical protein BDQ17DRAFT_1252028 [Cyathus striatus]|nr:hypothetical protein BDQ17DRAFT_1252028 [Cyathus striatus]